MQAAALGALARLGALTAADVEDALADGAPAVRRRAVEVALGGPGSGLALVAAARRHPRSATPTHWSSSRAAWFLAERDYRPAVPALAATATDHADARCREAAVAALGAIGDPAGLPAVLGALHDSPRCAGVPPSRWPASTTRG